MFNSENEPILKYWQKIGKEVFGLEVTAEEFNYQQVEENITRQKLRNSVQKILSLSLHSNWDLGWEVSVVFRKKTYIVDSYCMTLVPLLHQIVGLPYTKVERVMYRRALRAHLEGMNNEKQNYLRGGNRARVDDINKKMDTTRRIMDRVK